VNIVATYHHKNSLNIRVLAERFRLLFEPELFPAALYRIHDLGVTINIFYTGKCVLLGAKSEKSVLLSIKKLEDLLQQHEKPSCTEYP
jgi:TATA-box binding protein (TBP) (component of TFIID and TFIIIB)